MLRARALIGFALSLLAAGCVHAPHVRQPNEPLLFDRDLVLEGRPVTVHFSWPAVSDPSQPLLLYMTGDGGWHRKDKDVFERMTTWGYPLAGISAPDYLDHLKEPGTTTPGHVAADFVRLMAFARESLGLPPNRPVILVGVSRGADLDIVAAGRPPVRSALAGVLVVGLTREEEYVLRPRRRLRRRRPAPGAVVAPAPAVDVTDESPTEMVMFEPYRDLNRLQAVPLQVIQSTRDGYLPAAEARKLFGPDTPTRKLVPIEAGNHSFRGARETLYTEMAKAIVWIRSR